ncbi:transposase [Streptomyces goshikiensis]|uniref:transposase n=1 Tax=Streptomyces goshikiensis TaxID=1942 RepID=UPI0036571673
MTDVQWARIEPLLPDRTPRRGGRWRDHQQVIDAIAFKYRAGAPWMELPGHFRPGEGGPTSGCGCGGGRRHVGEGVHRAARAGRRRRRSGLGRRGRSQRT